MYQTEGEWVSVVQKFVHFLVWAIHFSKSGHNSLFVLWKLGFFFVAKIVEKIAQKEAKNVWLLHFSFYFILNVGLCCLQQVAGVVKVTEFDRMLSSASKDGRHIASTLWVRHSTGRTIFSATYWVQIRAGIDNGRLACLVQTMQGILLCNFQVASWWRHYWKMVWKIR